MNFSTEETRRLIEAVERMAPPPPPQKGLHRHEVIEKAISIRNTSKGKSLCQWTATEEPILVTEVNAITGGFVSLKWNVKPKTDARTGVVSYPEYLMVHMEASPTEVITIRSNLQSNWSFQLLMALESLSREALKDQFTILLLPNDMEKYDPAVFCRLYHNGIEVKYPYRKELKEDAAYLARLVESFDAYLNPAAESTTSGEAAEDYPEAPLAVAPQPVIKKNPERDLYPPVQSSLVADQIRAEVLRLGLATNPVAGKALIEKHFGEGAKSATLTADQRVEWLEILKAEKVESEEAEASSEVTSEETPEVAEAAVEVEAPQPIILSAEPIDREAFLLLTTKTKAEEARLGLTPAQIKALIKESFNKTARVNLSDEEATQYLEILKAK